MILAAGVGSRLDPLTRSVPKPLVPVVNQPVMEHIVRLLVRHGFDEIYCNTHYLAGQIESYFNERNTTGATLHFNREKALHGTAGGVKRVAEATGFFDPDETFLVIGGDDLTAIDLTAMLRYHKDKGAVATIGLTIVDDPSQFGVVVLNDDGGIARFVEKPPPGTAPSNLVNTGVYLFEPAILDMIPLGEFYDFGKQVFPGLLEAGQPFYGYEMNSYWRDVGNLTEYRDCQDDFFTGALKADLNLEQPRAGVWIGAGCEIDPTADIHAPALIGPRCRIGAGARIIEKSVLGEGCSVGEGATVAHSILWPRAQIGANTHIERCIVGFDCQVASNAGIFDAVIVSPKPPEGEGHQY